MYASTSGADPEIEEGGGTHGVGLKRTCGARIAFFFLFFNFFFFARAYNAQVPNRYSRSSPGLKQFPV